MRKLRVMTALAAVSLLVPAAASAGLSANDPEEASSNIAPVLSDTESAASDAAEFAKLHGVSQDVASRSLADGAALRQVTGQLRDLIGDREVSITKRYLPTTKLLVEISGTEPIPGVAEMADSAPSPVEITYVEMPSMEDLHQALLVSTKEWKSAFPQVLRTTIDDQDSDRVLVVIKPGTEWPSVSRLRELARDIPVNVVLKVTEQRPEEAPSLDSRGGLRLAGQGGPLECTSGFMATKNSTGTRVLLTAAHCGNALRYIGWGATSSWNNMTFQKAADGHRVDAQTHLTGGAGAAQIWTGSSYRTITSVTYRSQLANGDFICRYGMTSGQHCGAVQSTHSTFGGADVCNHGPCDNVWIATNMPTSGGDSGGPAFAAGSAIGMVKGHYGSLGVVGSMSYIRPELDVQIMGE